MNGNSTDPVGYHKFKLAVNRGLPCLRPHDLSGGLLLRRCTCTVNLEIPPAVLRQHYAKVASCAFALLPLIKRANCGTFYSAEWRSSKVLAILVFITPK